MRLLEVLIPTYGRPESAALAIESVLACDDDRISVRCNSNGYEPLLEKYRDYDKRVIYDCFLENRGVDANLLHLYKTTGAKFCMLLSDEDRLNSAGAKSFLDYLQELGEEIVVAASSIYDLTENKYYFMPNNRLVSRSIGINEFFIFDPISSYMSGLVFRASELKKLDLDSLLRPSLGNVYTHLDISLTLLKKGFLSFYQSHFVEKGEAIKFGGDGYSHIKSKENPKEYTLDDHEVNLNLNPEVYGPKARARQFYYQEKLFDSNSSDVRLLSCFIAKLGLIASYGYAIASSPSVVRLSENINVLGQAQMAYREALELKEISNSLACKYFRATSYLPLGLFKLNVRFIALLTRSLRFIIFRLFY
jgi:glycosyltransferase involved in cell wall biosynthesis